MSREITDAELTVAINSIIENNTHFQVLSEINRTSVNQSNFPICAVDKKCEPDQMSLPSLLIRIYFISIEGNDYVTLSTRK